jgi:hypothetical protein
MLKFKYPSKDQVPSDHAALYTERDGAWFLNAEGVVDSSTADELRKQKSALEQQLNELNKRFDGINPDDVRAQLEEKRKLEEAHALKTGEFDKLLQSRTQTIRSDFEKQLSSVVSERDALTAKLTDIQINQGVIIAGTRRGLRPTAIPDITARARSAFKLVNGVPRAFEPDGSTVRTGRDGVTPMTVEEWIDAQVSDAPHLFEPNSGSGALGNGDSPSRHNITNPWKRETWNLTKQGELTRTDPAKARALQAAAKN